LSNGVVSAEDFRFTDERYFNFFVANVLTPFKKIGIVQAAMDTAKSQKAQFGVLVSHLSAEMLTFGSEVKYVAACLEREIINHKATNPKQQKDFDFWLKNKGWEKFPAKAQKTAPTAAQTPKAEPIQQTAPKVQISENKAVLKVLPVPTAPAKLEDKEAKYPDFYFEQEAAEDRIETIQRIRNNFLVKLARVERVMDNKRKDLIEILQLEKIYTGDDFCLFLHDVCEGFPTESANVNAWIFLREFWDKQLAPKVCTAQKISIN
jgi:hypothetical protein